MRIALGLIIFTAIGCSGLVDDGGSDGLTSDELAARQAWFNKALPVLTFSCASCHVSGVGGSTPAPTFLAGESDLDMRETLLSHVPVGVDKPSLIDFSSPTRSELLAHGDHDGPALDGVQTSNLLEWILAEKKAAGDLVALPEVAKFMPTICTAGQPDDPAAPNPNCMYNRIPLDEVGGVGASIEFILQSLPGGSYLTNMRLVPGAQGVFMEHPIFVSWPLAEKPNCVANANGEFSCLDPLDRFATMTLNIMAGGAPEPMGMGNTTFTDFAATDMMSIRFTNVGPFNPMP